MTKPYRTAIIGVSGNRAKGHADAYQHIRKASSSLSPRGKKTKWEAFAKTHKVTPYKDYVAMLEREQIDLLHVNTPPDVRLDILEAAEVANVPLVVLEKPLAIQTEDYLGPFSLCQNEQAQGRYQPSTPLSPTPHPLTKSR